jgi:hypothetical protein
VHIFEDAALHVNIEAFTCKSLYRVVGTGYRATEALHFAFTCKTRIDTVVLIDPELDSATLARAPLLKQKGIFCEVYMHREDAEISEAFKPLGMVFVIKKENNKEELK